MQAFCGQSDIQHDKSGKPSIAALTIVSNIISTMGLPMSIGSYCWVSFLCRTLCCVHCWMVYCTWIHDWGSQLVPLFFIAFLATMLKLVDVVDMTSGDSISIALSMYANLIYQSLINYECSMCPGTYTYSVHILTMVWVLPKCGWIKEVYNVFILGVLLCLCLIYMIVQVWQKCFSCSYNGWRDFSVRRDFYPC